MTQQEYERIQDDLTWHYERVKRTLTTRQKETYKAAVLACKSVVSNYNPEKIKARAQRRKATDA